MVQIINFLKEYESESQYVAQAGPESQQSFYLRLLTAEIKNVFLWPETYFNSKNYSYEKLKNIIGINLIRKANIVKYTYTYMS